jgi:hypothetical protein
VPGERERYRTVLSRASFAAEASYRRAELIVTTRQMIVRAQDHSVHRTPLETITEVHSQVDRQLLSSAFRVTISRRSGPPIKLECTDAEQMAAVAQQLEKVRVSGPVSPR